ncbi:MAG: ribonuclease III [Caldilineaceae bacterium]|nr:ribonuclease III [Caldilineaceae bacterium]MBP8107042.1 ribonuclease III [Caldilineaceae bacterium]MBP8121080.1 ribonuclease III [Caldilineaceae bacterium]MBP9070803.1 ribonuclease III [Caldilineaceae bacterium]
MDGRSTQEFLAAIGMRFGNVSLLERAFVHRSYVNEYLVEGVDDQAPADNERLEFLGDSVLSMLVSELLFTRYPNRQEGDLTTLRAALVRRETLARFAVKLNLGEFLMLGNGEEESGGRSRPATLCATYEAVLGAIYVDQGLEAVRAFVIPVVETELAQIERSALEKDPKSRVQEWVQSTFGRTPRYKTVASIGPDHDKLFTIQVSAGGIACGVGRGRSKQEAAQLAAAHALHRLGQLTPEYLPDPELEALWPMPDVDEGFGPH